MPATFQVSPDQTKKEANTEIEVPMSETADVTPKPIDNSMLPREPMFSKPSPHSNRFTTTPMSESTLPALQQKIIASEDIEADTDLRTDITPRAEPTQYRSEFYNTVDPGILRRVEVSSELRGMFNDRPGREPLAEHEWERMEPFPRGGPARPKWDRVPSYKPQLTRQYAELQ